MPAFHSHRPGRIMPLLAAGVSLLASIFAAAPAEAITFDANGNVVGWNVTPFSQPNGVTTSGGITSVRQNNYSPLNYPNGIGHQPSPGGATGEKFDLEELHIRNDGSQVQVLLIASSLFHATASGSTLDLGDLLIDLDGDHQFDLGVVSLASNGGLDAGRLYEIDQTLGLQNRSGSYRGTSIDTQIGAWAIDEGVGHDLYNIETAGHNFGGSEGMTYAYQFTFDLDFLDTMPTQFAFQLAWGCGNDMINADYSMTLPPPPPTILQVTAVPEPAPVALLIIVACVGLGLLGRMRRPERV